LKDLLLRSMATSDNADGVVLKWFSDKVAMGQRLPELVEVYHTTLQAISLLLKQKGSHEETKVSKSN